MQVDASTAEVTRLGLFAYTDHHKPYNRNGQDRYLIMTEYIHTLL